MRLPGMQAARRRVPGAGLPVGAVPIRDQLGGASVSWRLSFRASPSGRAIADRHYNRQSIGSAQFVPPGRCIVLIQPGALWVTSWPFPQFVKHEWAGAWVNSLFRNEGVPDLASNLIRSAIAATRYQWEPPVLGMITFVDPKAVPGVPVRGERVFGYSYLKAGFRHVGFTKSGLWAWQMLPDEMPEPEQAVGQQALLFA
jgi:hypothetical protein